MDHPKPDVLMTVTIYLYSSYYSVLYCDFSIEEGRVFALSWTATFF